MNLVFEESGDFKIGTVLSQVGESYQIELQGGKRTKVRSKDVLLQYPAKDPAQTMLEAQKIADELDLDFLWEVAGEDEFVFTDLGAEYFGHVPMPHEAIGLLIKLHSAPIYFYRKGKGRYKTAPEKSLKAALISIEKKRQQAIIQAQYVEQMKAKVFPDGMKPLALQLLCKPDKNGMEYKALIQACSELQTTPERLMIETGAIDSPYTLHRSRFVFEHFPKGTDFSINNVEVSLPDLPVSDVKAFSIDDITTTEIDDAFSVTHLTDGNFKIGIHIAAPALGIKPGDDIDVIARQRMSTVYMPGDKITMLPDEYVRIFTLGSGEERPAISLYATIAPNDYQLIKTETCIERIRVDINLRHNELEKLVTEENLAQGVGEYPFKKEIEVLWGWAKVLEQNRMEKRESFGLKPEQIHHPDYNFYVQDGIVTIEQRMRTAPLDKVVAELMIFANSTWGRFLKEHGVPGVYRSQGEGNGSWVSRRLVRMQTYPAAHHGLGVDQYAWCTSPLRRYTDLVNQWQICACINYGVTAPLSAPFKPKDADLYAILSSFDSIYAIYNEFQAKMERYWCLRWLAQNNVKRVEAIVVRDEMVRLVEIPLTLSLPAVRVLGRNAQITIELINWDEIDLSVEARLIEVIKNSEQTDSMELSEDIIN